MHAIRYCLKEQLNSMFPSEGFGSYFFVREIGLGTGGDERCKRCKKYKRYLQRGGGLL